MKGTVTRKFNTGDTADDFILDFVTYTMHAKIGEINDTDTVFRFDEMSVNFADFLADETNYSLFGYQAAGLSVLGSLFAMLG